MRWIDYGAEDMDVGLGIVVATEKKVERQWREDHEAVRRLLRERMLMLQETTSPSARVQLVRGAYASLLPYKAQVQVSRVADVEIERTQQELNRAVFGDFPFITYASSYHDYEDGGIRQIHLHSRLEAGPGRIDFSVTAPPPRSWLPRGA